MNIKNKEIIQKKKKSGFTIIEISIVLSVMLLLMAVFLPTVSGVLADSKRTGVVGEAQTVVFAWQTINSKTNANLTKDKTKGDLLEIAEDDDEKFSEYFNLGKIKSIPDEATVERCMEIVEGGEFEVDKDGMLDLNKTDSSS